MRAFYHPDQALHDPKQFMRVGVIADPTDLPERTARLLGALADLSITPEHPGDHGEEPILAIHSKGYIDFLKTAYARWIELPKAGPEVLPNTFPYWSGRPEQNMRPDCRSSHIVAQTGHYLGDLAVPLGEHSWTSIRASAQTAIAAAEAVLGGEKAAYALCRPSGHHSRGDRASGFCYVNNSAIAAQILRSKFAKVAVLDVDAHHGDGTQEIFYRRGDVLTISTHVDPNDYYPYFTGREDETGSGEGEGANLNLPLPVGAGDDQLMAAIEVALEKVKADGVEALVLALGYDAHAEDPLSALKISTEGFGRIGARLAQVGLPLVVVQEGGYGIPVIGGCLKAFIENFDA